MLVPGLVHMDRGLVDLSLLLTLAALQVSALGAGLEELRQLSRHHLRAAGTFLSATAYFLLD